MMSKKRRFFEYVALVLMMILALSTTVYASEIKKVTVKFETKNNQKEPDIKIETRNVFIESKEWSNSFDDLKAGDENLVTLKVKAKDSNEFSDSVVWYINGEGIKSTESYNDDTLRILKVIYEIQDSQKNHDRFEHNNSNNYDRDLNGWEREGNSWYYYKNGEKIVDDWIKVDGQFYYLNSNGKMLANTTKRINGNHYHFNFDGSLSRGWYRDDGLWYYSDRNSGVQYRDAWLDGDSQYSGTYYFDSNGIMCTGWKKFSNNTWYYFNPSGIMLRNTWVPCNNLWCYLGSNGIMYTGWAQIDNKWYYFNSDGYMQ